ncbi:uracil-DNA glycosylase family protein [Ruegeria sp. ANG-R]|uniref:uracil-DNA glycosylase family protein n=1 Tax=Ruegeria sp. ANG-R TaxID=1577903 RepID=UPI0009E3F50A|nr:uracil-DNA glycosylase family protein [Ruegeria sp. ANG-R]
MRQDFQKLKLEMLACRLCKELPLGPSPIFQLEEHAKILIVGQAPGRLAHLKKRPFDDPSGNRLRDWLAIDRSTFYADPRIGIFPMGLCFPGTGSAGDNPPPKICATTWRNRVLQSLKNVELTLVLGAYAIAWHTPHLKGQSVTGAVKQSSTGRGDFFVLPHPSPRNNKWLKKNAWFEADVIPRIQKKVKQVLNGSARS